MMAGLVPLVLYIILLVDGWRWAALYDRRPTIRLLAALVLLSALIVLFPSLLSLFGLLTARSLLVCSALWLAGGALIRGYWAPHREKPSGKNGYERWTGTPFPSRLGLGLGLYAALIYLGLIGIGLLVPPYAWDTLVYHLTFVFHAARAESLTLFPFPGPQFFFPQAGELHSLWAFLLGGGGDQAWRLTGLALVPLALTSSVAVKAACEGLQLRAASAWIVPAVLVTPVVMIQPLSGYVDLPFTAFLLAAFAFAILAAREERFAHLAWCALASGLAMGVKYAFLYFSLPILAVLAGMPVWRLLTRGGVIRILGRLLGLKILFWVGCGYWLGRSAFTTGNPFFPAALKFGGLTVFSGPYGIVPNTWQQSWFVPDTASWIRYPFLETFHGVPLYTLENGFGPLFAAGFLATLAALILALFRRHWVLVRALLSIPLTVAAFLWVSPFQEPRYVIACCGFGLMALAVLAEEAHPFPWPRRVLTAAVATGVVFSGIAGLVSSVPHFGRTVREWRAGTWNPTRYYLFEYGTAGEAFNWLEEQAGPGKTVTFTNGNFIAPLFGWGGRNRVVFAGTPGDWGFGPAPQLRTYAAWRRFLADEKVDWVVVWVPWWFEKSDRINEHWIEQHPGEFELIKEFGGPEQVRARIFRPVFDPQELQRLKEGNADLDGLGDAGAWTVEFTTGADLKVSAGEGGGVRLEYAFLSSENDYADLKAGIQEGRWSGARYLGFDLKSDPASTLLFVYLKDRDPRKNGRWQIDLRDQPQGGSRVRLDLHDPDARTEGFSLDEVAEVHLVLDDFDDDLTGRGVLAVSGFRLEGSASKNEGFR